MHSQPISPCCGGRLYIKPAAFAQKPSQMLESTSVLPIVRDIVSVDKQSKSVTWCDQKRVSFKCDLGTLAGLLQNVQDLPACHGYNLVIAQKVLGGVCAVHRETQQATWIMKGVDYREWPMLSNNSLRAVQSMRDSQMWGAPACVITGLEVCSGLQTDLRVIAAEIVRCLRQFAAEPGAA